MFIKIIKFSKRERVIFYLTIGVLLAAVFYNLLMEPILKKWVTINREILVKQTAVKKALKILSQREKVKLDYYKYTESINDASNLVSYIEKTSTMTGILPSNIKVQPIKKDKLTTECIIELEAQGSFNNILRFISELSKPPLFITIKKFYLTSVEGQDFVFKGKLVLSKLII